MKSYMLIYTEHSLKSPKATFLVGHSMTSIRVEFYIPNGYAYPELE